LIQSSNIKTTLKSLLTGLTLKTILYFALAALPFIILPFAVVSNGHETTSGTRALEAALKSASGANQLSTRQRKSESVFAKARIGYDVSVLRAVREMGLVLDHFDMWIDQHPGTALAHVRFMPAAMQEKVASIALFVRKSNSKIDEKTAWREAAAFVHYSAKYGIPAALTAAVAKAESAFDPDALSSKGASGVMQVRWTIHSGLLRSNGIHATSSSNPLSDPEKAIAAGCLLLSRYIKAYGSVQAAMIRYSGDASNSYFSQINMNMASLMNHHAQLTK
jgi:soluble lytic murein transglycosylase-like protein